MCITQIYPVSDVELDYEAFVTGTKEFAFCCLDVCVCVCVCVWSAACTAASTAAA